MYAVIAYRPEADPGQYEPRGVDPFAGIELVGIYMEGGEADRRADEFVDKNPNSKVIVMRPY